MSRHGIHGKARHVQNGESMLNLLLELEGASHEDLLLQHLVALIEGLPKGFLIANLKNLFR